MGRNVLGGSDRVLGGNAGSNETQVLVAAPTGVYATDRAAVIAARDAAGVGGTFKLQDRSKGKYQFDQVSLLSRQKIIADGALVERSPSGVAQPIFTASSPYGIEISGIEFAGQRGSATAGTNPTILFTQPTFCKIKNCGFVDNPGSAGDAENSNPAANLWGANKCEFSGNYIVNSGYGLNLGSLHAENLTSTGNIVKGNWVDGTDWNSFFFSGNINSINNLSFTGRVVGTIFEGNVVMNSGDCGVESGVGTVGTQINDNIFIGNGSTGNQGILFRGSQGGSATGNTVLGYTAKSGSVGINVWDFNGWRSDGITLTANTVEGNRFRALLVRNSDNVKVDGGSYSKTTEGAGISFSNSNNFVVTNATDVIGNGQQGVLVGHTSEGGANNGLIEASILDNGKTTNRSLGQTPSFDGVAVVGDSSNVTIRDARIRDTRVDAEKTQRRAVTALNSSSYVTIADTDVRGNFQKTNPINLGGANGFGNSYTRCRGVSWGIPSTLAADATVGAGTFPNANRAYFVRVRDWAAYAVTSLRVTVGVQSGNISLAVYSNSGVEGSNAAPGTLKSTSGAVACPAPGNASVTIPEVDIEPGDWLALSCDNTTASFTRHASGNNDNAVLQGLARSMATAHPAPAAATGTSGTSYMPAIGA